MPNIPDYYTARPAAGSGRSAAGAIPGVDPAAFGVASTAVGTALREAGGQVAAGAVALVSAERAAADRADVEQRRKEAEQRQSEADDRRVKSEAETERNRVVRRETSILLANFDPTPIKMQAEREAAETGGDAYTLTRDRLIDHIRSSAEKIEEPDIRDAYIEAAYSRMPGYLSQAGAVSEAQAQQRTKVAVDAGLATQMNRVRTDPTSYTDAFDVGAQLIQNAAGVTAIEKAGMTAAWRDQTSDAYFRGLLDTAKTPADIEGIALRLADDKEGWTSKLRPTTYYRLLDELDTKKGLVSRGITSTARAQIQDAEAQTNSLVRMSEQQLRDIKASVTVSGDPTLFNDYMRVVRNQGILRQEGSLPAAELTQRIAQTNGGVANLPGMPTEVSQAIADTVQLSGGAVSAQYLMATALKEYGGKLKPEQAPIPETAKPVFLSSRTSADDLNVQSKMALVNAGLRLQRPVQVVSVGDKGNTVEVSTVGMADPDKTALVSALIDAGFTGINERPNSYEFYMRSDVPESFGRSDDKGVWGGWSYLSQPTLDAIKDKGISAKRRDIDIKRDTAGFIKPAAVDYGVKAEGTSATGLYQFVKSTWLELMNRPGVREILGVSPNLTSEEQLLALRSNPTMSTKMAAIYAMQNKAALENSLRRPITDGELYLAHFLGPGGAVALLSNAELKPNQIAADVLPDAAAANKNVFYRNGKPVTVRELVDNVNVQFATEPDVVQFEDNEFRKRILDKQKELFNKDQVAFISSTGVLPVGSIDNEAGMAERGNTMRAFAQMYDVPRSKLLPLSEAERDKYASIMESGDVDRQLGAIKELSVLGRDIAPRAYQQVAGDNKVLDHVAGYINTTGDYSVARTVLKGAAILKENPSVKTQLGLDSTNFSEQFHIATRGAFMGLRPQDAQAVEEAAIAYFVGTTPVTGTVKTDNERFTNAIRAVLGGNENVGGFGEVNGRMTVLPIGTNPKQVERALEKASPIDWLKLSPSRELPLYSTGQPVNLQDVKSSLRLEAIGNGIYRLVLPDDKYAMTSSGEAYTLKLDRGTVEELETRPQGLMR